MENKSIVLDGQIVSYTFTRKNVKNVNLRVKPGGIYVSANPAVPIKFIEEFIVSNKDFILKNLARLQEIPKPIAHECKTGEVFWLLGEKLILQVIKSNREDVCVEGEHLLLYTYFIDDIDKKVKALNKFYMQKCVEVFDEIITEIHPIFKEMKVAYPNIKLRTMKSKWGSCMPSKNQITLNTKLIELPKECIEYVVLHEFCHFIHPNHSKDFYGLIGELMPDYKCRVQLMKTNFV